MEIFGNDLGAKKGKKGQIEYYCEKCDYKCYKKYSWERHIDTSKHKQEILVDDLGAKKGKKWQTEYVCEKCENTTFQEALMLRKVSRFLTGDAQDGLMPIATFACIKCGHVNQEFYPKELVKNEQE